MLKCLLTFTLLIALSLSECVHDQFIKNTSKVFYNDLTDKRLLQSLTPGPLRSFFDYSQVSIGTLQQKVTIKRAMEIAGQFFYDSLTVLRLPKLYYPNDAPTLCNALNIPTKYITLGLDADVGIVVGSQDVSTAPYVAKSTACAFLQSNSRPIWGMIAWNVDKFEGKHDQMGFQQIVAAGLHELTHVLAFSSLLFDLYPAGSPLIGNFQTYSDFKLISPRINFEVQKHYGCNNPFGMDLEDQDGTLIASHWEKHHVGNEFMIASTRQNAYIGAVTLALYEATGWYNVSYQYTEPTVWGKNKGCNFLNIDNCDFDEFCSQSGVFDCTYEYKEIGACLTDSFTGSCRIFRYFPNTVCNNETYQIDNVNAGIGGQQRGGSDSRCWKSDMRAVGKDPNLLNNRCYISICYNSVIYILISSTVRACVQGGNSIIYPSVSGMTGQVTCPTNFDNFCRGKQNCAFNCNRNGICINGLCLCTGNSGLTPSCDVPIPNNDPFGATGGRMLFEVNEQENQEETKTKSFEEIEQILRCPQGQIFDPTSQHCQSCEILLGCKLCNVKGCLNE